MGEIKSTLDLVMEKTRGLSLDAEEKRKFEKQEAEKRARGLFLKYEEGLWTLEQLREAVTRNTEADPALLEREVSRLMIDSIAPDMPEGISLRDIRDWVGEGSASDMKAAGEIIDEYKTGEEELYTGTIKSILDGLERIGIWGSAIQPKVREDEQWRLKHNELYTRADIKLEKIQSRLHGLV